MISLLLISVSLPFISKKFKHSTTIENSYQRSSTSPSIGSSDTFCIIGQAKTLWFNQSVLSLKGLNKFEPVQE